jgi:hypothetical protein
VYANTTTNPPEVAIMKLNVIILIIVFGLLTTTIPVSALDIGDVSGQVEFIIRTGGSALDKTIYIKNVADTNESYLGYPITIQPCGISLPEIFVVGDFYATLYNGNGGQKEIRGFSISPREQKRINFIGHGVSSGNFNILPITPTPTPFIDPECLHRPEHRGCPNYRGDM